MAGMLTASAALLRELGLACGCAESPLSAAGGLNFRDRAESTCSGLEFSVVLRESARLLTGRPERRTADCRGAVTTVMAVTAAGHLSAFEYPRAADLRPLRAFQISCRQLWTKPAGAM